MSDPLERIESQLSHQSNEMKALTKAISDLATTLAIKEERDHHIDESIREVKKDMTLLKEDIIALKLISAGDNSMRLIFQRTIFVTVGLVVSAVLYTVFTK